MENYFLLEIGQRGQQWVSKREKSACVYVCVHAFIYISYIFVYISLALCLDTDKYNN